MQSFFKTNWLHYLLVILLFAGSLVGETVSPKDRLIVETLIRLNRFDVSGNEKWKGAVQRYARSQRGEEGYFELVEQFSVKAELPELLRLVEEDPTSAPSAKSVQLIFRLREQKKLSRLLSGSPKKKAKAILTLIGFVKTPEAQKLLDEHKALSAPATSVAKEAPALISTADDITALAARTGNVKQGKAVFQKFCFACHKAGDLGLDFGPGLSEIGSKLPKSELLLAIVKPNAGISFDYEGWTVETKQGSFLAGIVSESDEELTVRMVGGVSQKVKKADVAKRTKMKASLMPEGLHLAMSERELVDLVEFLASLRAK
jgi:putative heme-binding domain-containing protein